MQKASFTSRAVGFCLEYFLSYVVFFFFSYLIYPILTVLVGLDPQVDGKGYLLLAMFYGIHPYFPYILIFPDIIQHIAEGGSFFGSSSQESILAVLLVISMIMERTIISTLIEFMTAKNRSLGHRIIQSQVTFVRPQSKARSLLTLLLRNLLKFTFWYLFPFLLLPIFTKEHLPLHDVLSGTRVVKLSDT